MVLKNPIADWWFEDRSEVITIVDKGSFNKLLNMTQKCTDILVDHLLFRPTKVVFSERWLIANGSVIEGVTKTELSITVNSERTLYSDILNYVKSVQSGDGFIYPSSFQVLGSGVVLESESNKVEVYNLVSLEAQFTEVPVVDVITCNDIWLPYSLSGEKQEYGSSLNAPRLEAALKEVELELGVEAVTDDISDYCRINGYKLDNLRDIDGNPLRVDEDGRIL